MADIKSMTVPKLKEYAAANIIQLKSSRKDDIIAEIEAAQQAAATPPTSTHDTPEATAATNTTPTTPDAPESKQVAPDAAATQETPPVDPVTDPQAGQPPAPDAPCVIARMLKVTKPLMKGDDVKFVQSALIANKFGCGVEGANGVFNAATAYALRQFQAMNRLIVSGRVDIFTARALGAEWGGEKLKIEIVETKE